MVLEKDVASDELTDKELFMIGNKYSNNDDIEMAKKYLLMAIDKGNTKAMFELGDIFLTVNDYANAKKYFMMGKDLDTEFYAWIGKFYERINCKNNEDIECYKQGADKNNFLCIKNLAIKYQNANNLQQTDKYYSLAMAHSDIDKETIVDYIDFLLRAKKYEKICDIFGCFSNNFDIENIFNDSALTKDDIMKVLQIGGKKSKNKYKIIFKLQKYFINELVEIIYNYL